MKTMEPSLNPAEPRANDSQESPVSLETTGRARLARKKHLEIVALVVAMPLGGIAVLFYLLRAIPAEVLRREFEGMGVVICAFAYIGVFLLRLRHALTQDTQGAEKPASVNNLCGSSD